MPEENDWTVDDAVLLGQRALTRANELKDDLDELRKEYDDTVEEVTALKLRLSEISDERAYESLSLDEKVGMVREHAFNRAVESNGKAALDYNDVMWGVFDGEPGSDHCYKLMRLAAGVDDDGNEVQDVSGFTFRRSTRPMKLAVNAARAKRGAAFSSENKTGWEGSSV